MAEDMDVAQAADLLGARPLSDARRGRRNSPGVRRGNRRAIKAADAGFLREVVAELHEADLGDLIEALEPDDRVSLVELTGADFDFSALNEVDDTVREEILEELEPRDGRGRRSRTGIRRRRRIARGARRGGPGGNPRKAAAVGARRARAQPGISGKFRRTADADRIHRGAAGLDRRAGDRLHARHAGSAGPVLRNLRGRQRPALAGRGVAGRAAALAPAGAAGRSDRRRPPPRLGDGRPGRGGAAVRQIQSGRGARGRYRQPAGRRHHRRRRGRRDRGGGRRGPEGARRRHQRRRTVRQCLDHRQGPLQLAAGQSRHRLPGVLGARPVRGPAGKDGGAGGAGADRRQPGRQCRDPDHDGRGARAGDPRTRLRTTRFAS